MGRLLTAADFKNTYGKAPLFLRWANAYYHSDLTSASNTLLVNADERWHNPVTYIDRTPYDSLVRADTISKKDTLITIVIPSGAEYVGFEYCPSGFTPLIRSLGSSDRMTALNGTYSNSNTRVGLFNANYVFNYLGGTMYKATNGSLTSYTINQFIDECNMSMSDGYYLLKSRLDGWLGTIAYAIYYDGGSDSSFWEYLYLDYPDNIYANLNNYDYEAGIVSNTLYTGAFINSSYLSNSIAISSLSYTYCFDKRLNNNTASLSCATIFKFGDLFSSGEYNLAALEFIVSNVNFLSFNYYNSNNYWRTYDGPTLHLFSTPFLTPGIGYLDLSTKDINGDNTFNIYPRVIDRGTINEIVGVRKTNKSGNLDYVIGTRHIYSLFYIVPFLGGNGGNKFNPTTELGYTNNEIHAILHHYGNASSFDEL